MRPRYRDGVVGGYACNVLSAAEAEDATVEQENVLPVQSQRTELSERTEPSKTKLENAMIANDARTSPSQLSRGQFGGTKPFGEIAMISVSRSRGWIWGAFGLSDAPPCTRAAILAEQSQREYCNDFNEARASGLKRI